MRRSKEIPVGFSIWPEEVNRVFPMQGRLHIPGDPNLGEEKPVKVFESDVLYGQEVVVTGGTPVIDNGRTRLVESILWEERVLRNDDLALEAMRMLRKLDPEESIWGKLAQQYQRRNNQLHRKILTHLVLLKS